MSCEGCVFFFQAEDGIRDLVRSRGLGDVYKRQGQSGLTSRWVSSEAPLRLSKHSSGVFAAAASLALSLIHI